MDSLCGLALSVGLLTSAQRGPIVPFVPDPKVPMPAAKEWKDPGYLKIVWIQSPNCDSRKAGSPVDTIVIHSTAIDSLEKTTEVFQRTKENPVSAERIDVPTGLARWRLKRCLRPSECKPLLYRY